MTRNRLINISLSVALVATLIAVLQAFVLAPAKERAKARVCHDHLERIRLATRDYARQHGTGYQTNLVCLSNQLGSPSLLSCVSDGSRRHRLMRGNGSAEHWATLTMEDCSYEALLRGTNTLVLRCPIHKITRLVE